MRVLNEERENKVYLLPETEDIQKLTQFLENELKVATERLKKDKNLRNWRNLANATMAPILLFNKKRDSEVGAILKEDYKTKFNWADTTQDIQRSFDNSEKIFARKFTMIKVKSKNKSKVPVIIKDAELKSLELLDKCRSEVRIGLLEENPYFFSNSKLGYMSAQTALTNLSNQAGLKNPERIKSKDLRKYAASVSQILFMTVDDIRLLTQHMGHSFNVHHEHYRLPQAALELTRIAKLMTIIDAGRANECRNMTLAEIDYFEAGVSRGVSRSTSDSNAPPPPQEIRKSIQHISKAKIGRCGGLVRKKKIR